MDHHISFQSVLRGDRERSFLVFVWLSTILKMKIKFMQNILSGWSGKRDIEIQLQISKYLGMNISEKSNESRRVILFFLQYFQAKG